MAAAACLVGPRRMEPARRAARVLVERFSEAGLKDALDETFDFASVTLDDETRSLLVGEAPDAGAEAMLAGLRERGGRSAFVRYLEGLDGHPTADAVLAAVTVTLAWGPLMRRRISRLTVETLPWWMRLFGTLLGASVEADRHQADRFCGVPNEEILGRRSLTEVAYLALLGQEAQAEDLFAFQTLIGLLLTGNGPGAISIQGVKGAVSADGPETPERVQLIRLWSVFCPAATRTAATATRASPSCSTSSAMPVWKTRRIPATAST